MNSIKQNMDYLRRRVDRYAARMQELEDVHFRAKQHQKAFCVATMQSIQLDERGYVPNHCPHCGNSDYINYDFMEDVKNRLKRGAILLRQARGDYAKVYMKAHSPFFTEDGEVRGGNWS